MLTLLDLHVLATNIEVYTCVYNLSVYIKTEMIFLLRAVVFVVLVPSVSQTGSIDDDYGINLAGFVCLVVLQCGADLMLLLALDHEQRFRSSGMGCYGCVGFY